MNRLCETARRYGPLAGRALIALIFILAGYHKLGAFAQTAARMAAKGLPAPDLLLALTIAVELGGGLMVLLGWHARRAAAVFFLWLIPVTLVFHPFWLADAAQAQNQMNHFLKNLAIMGAMLYIVAHGPGPLSLGKDRCPSQPDNI